MMLTALYCQKHGLTFTSVHDSFWTHACDVDTMNKVRTWQVNCSCAGGGGGGGVVKVIFPAAAYL